MVNLYEGTMSYRNAMGLMYATAGLGDAALPPKAVTATSATTSDKQQRTVRQLQQLLQSRGFSPGTLDGVYGDRTEAALQRAISATPAVSADRTQVWLRANEWAQLEALPSTSAPITTIEPDGTFSIVEEGTDYTPWLLGAGALLAVGGYFVWKGKKRVKRNSRRRSRR
jgi:peptidoglycan hydrolase-like protein with peptidoglycan-binding domain